MNYEDSLNIELENQFQNRHEASFDKDADEVEISPDSYETGILHSLVSPYSIIARQYLDQSRKMQEYER